MAPDAFPTTPLPPAVLIVAPNGARRGKDQHPNLPVTIAETVTAARDAHEAGAAMLHLHVRDDQGRHSLDAGRYREAIAAVSAAVPGMAIQITTESAGIFEAPAQFACLQAVVPAAASVAVREIARDPGVAARLYRFAEEAGIALQHILYDADDLARLDAWWADGTVPARQRMVIFVLGAYADGRHGAPEEAPAFAQRAEALGLNWSLCAFGPREHACVAMALALGGHARIGFENNLVLPDGRRAPDNAALVALMARQAQLFGRPLADGAAARRLFGLTR